MSTTKPIYDIFTFISKIDILTITIFGSFITIKFFNALYENVYEPFIESLIESNENNKYYITIGKKYISVNKIFNEFTKWIILLIFLMFLYNIFKKIKK